MAEIDIARLRQLVQYHPDGELIHRPRPKSDFSKPGVYAAWKKRWEGKPACQNVMPEGYRRGTIDGVMVLLHRAIFAYHHGYWPSHVDHRDTDTSNNRIGNLRDATKSQNGANTLPGTRTNATGYKGVRKITGGSRYFAQLNIGGKKHYGGSYDTAEEAARAYDKLAKEHHGEFARLNFPE